MLSFEVVLRFLAMLEERPVRIGVLERFRSFVNSIASSIDSLGLLTSSFASLATAVSDSPKPGSGYFQF